MNLRQVEAFRLVMLRGSMTAAAQELGTSQPSISRLIAELEAATGLALFTRIGGRIRATDAGSAFYREVDRSFVGLEKLEHSAREIRQLGTGRLRIVAAPVLALSLLPMVIERFLAAYPRVIVSLEMRSEGTIQRWVSSAYCDVGFATVTPDAFGVTSADLYRLPGLCALPVRHPLVARTSIDASDLRGERLILPSYADDTRAPLDRVLRPAGADQVPAVETPYGATICALVSRGLGIGIVNPLAALDANPRRIAFRPFTPAILFRGFTLCPQLQQANPVVETFLKLVRETMEREIGALRAGRVDARSRRRR
ncbi:LysR substrate-binding domain-containing protein [Paraburkholderia sp. SOS3]|uniref:LysR substrate-binding domain-containing protein n=1 Tax=Paraburkholderia sp. SOS3 TaxID=1926494 RepID=UPI00094742F0|nr:LysR substrate-binding domain-containing protein [Paraburkholderia sp. SOS3]APR38711.1 LysR family transcriptional regulator [Paraburkholderia sp. SOS3]